MPATRDQNPSGVHRGGHGSFHLDFGVPVSSGHFVRRAVCGGDDLQDVCLGFFGMRGNFGTQIFLGVIPRVLDQRRIFPGQVFPELSEVLIDGARRAAVHDAILIR
jgi:hypothetical protein